MRHQWNDELGPIHTSCRCTRRPSDRRGSPPFPLLHASPVFLIIMGAASLFGLFAVGFVTFVAWELLGWRDTLPGIALLVGFAIVGYATVAEWLEEK